MAVGRFEIMSLVQAARAYVKVFDKDILLSTDDFFRTAYRPVREEWVEKWTEAIQTNAK